MVNTAIIQKYINLWVVYVNGIAEMSFEGIFFRNNIALLLYYKTQRCFERLKKPERVELPFKNARTTVNQNSRLQYILFYSIKNK